MPILGPHHWGKKAAFEQWVRPVYPVPFQPRPMGVLESGYVRKEGMATSGRRELISTPFILAPTLTGEHRQRWGVTGFGITRGTFEPVIARLMPRAEDHTAQHRASEVPKTRPTPREVERKTPGTESANPAGPLHLESGQK